LIDTAARLRGVETKIEAAQVRLKALDDNEQALHQSLSNRQAAIGEVLAALQRVGRRPPPALMASPEDALQAVRTAMLLGAVLPEMRSQVVALAKNLSDLANVRKQIAAEQEKLKADVASLGAERARVQALVAERQKKQTDREQALEAERRARPRPGQAGGQSQGSDRQTRAGPRNGAPRRRAPRLKTVAVGAARSRAAVAGGTFCLFARQSSYSGNGIRIREFGAPDATGTVEKGVSIATRAGAQVTAPADGWVVYAGPFRSYGQLLILNTGGGYHVLLAGMERISVDLGQFVLAGEPVAIMGNGSQIAALLAIGSSQPVLYVEFRKDGTPVDPGPWWAAGEGEKVRG